jgi:phage terminase large subunit-like protein
VPRKRASSSATNSYVFDMKAADKAVAFIETYCSHVKGEKAGQPLILMPWQRAIVRDVFGWKRRCDGTRRYRTLYLSCGRKQGKSLLSAAVALFLLLSDDEPGAEIISAAADRDQARIIFDLARRMVESHAELRTRAELYQSSIVVPKTGSTYKVISAEAYSKHGLNVHAALVDELHAIQGRELVDVLVTAQGARRQPLTVFTTTAGWDQDSIGYEIHHRAELVRDGAIDDPEFYPAIFAAALEDDWTRPATWAKANPGLGHTIKREYLEAQCRRAQETPGYVQTFRRLHCNQWVESAERWLDLAAWDEGALPVDLAALAGRTCYGGLDLASTSDLAAFVLIFPSADGSYDVESHFWCPAAGIAKREQTDKVPYAEWARAGHLVPTGGDAIDFDVIRESIRARAQQVRIASIAYDSWNAVQITGQLEQDGATMIKTPQTIPALNAASKELEKLVTTRAIRHGGHPVLRWNVANTAIETDPAGNFKPSKRKSGATKRIDGVVALVMALDQAIRHAGEFTSVYDQRLAQGLPVLTVL